MHPDPCTCLRPQIFDTNGAVFSYRVPTAAKAGTLTARDLPFERVLPDPVPNTNPAGPFVPRGIAVGGPGPLLYVGDAAGRLITFKPTAPYTFTGLGPGCRLPE